VSSAARVRLEDLVTTRERRARYESQGHWDSTTLAARVTEWAAERPAATAVVDQAGRRQVSYAELDRDANRVAAFLAGVGVGPGDVVSVQLPNWYETVAVDLGVLKLGAVLNPMITLYRGRELRHMLTTAQSKVLFTPGVYRDVDYPELVAELREDVPDLLEHVAIGGPEGHEEEFHDWLEQQAAHPPVVTPVASDVSELIFTSGTEAVPKAIMHTEQTTNFSVRSVWTSLGMNDGDVVLMPSPIGHSTGLNFGVRAALYHGVPIVLQDKWAAADAVELIERFRCSFTVAATTFVRDIVERAQRTTCDLSSLRLLGSGGAPIPPSLVVDARELGLDLLRLYGATEFLCLTWNRPASPDDKKSSTDGLALDHQEVEVRDEDGRPVRNEPGEIFARTPGGSVGFFRDPERTRATFGEDGWLRSGDLGVLDDDGYVTVVGRKKEIIIRGGLNIAPREIEDLICKIPAVAAVAVVGLPDDRLGELTCACVVLRDGETLRLGDVVEELKREGLATYKLPQAMTVVDALPATASGKIQKHVLLDAILASADTIERV
jgi:acyl-coenzyme A synthetase/AMP-(fatty) acid ligase